MPTINGVHLLSNIPVDFFGAWWRCQRASVDPPLVGGQHVHELPVWDIGYVNFNCTFIRVNLVKFEAVEEIVNDLFFGLGDGLVIVLGIKYDALNSS